MSFLVHSKWLYRCPKNNCGKMYKSKGNLSRHLKDNCNKRPIYKCPYCTKTCSLKNNMKTHIGLVHKQITDFDSYIV